ncbi:protein numb homolog [Antedon mediterranea]|uniref:protein numb homolog n=1 Tax=Antedon mediterranea TaxID=105859 RepID=UPI003AF62CD7
MRINHGLLVDQTIEKVSFCAPDRNHDKGFSYICRDGTTRRWLCHCFQSLRDPGERLSHAVGCAFAACLERKQQRDKLCGVKIEFDVNKTTFTRQGSFRQATMTEQLAEAEEERNKENGETQPGGASVNPYAIPRRHAPDSLLQRQGSCRLFPALDTQSPFKRNLSLRLNELPSTLQRQQQSLHTHTELSPIHSPTHEQKEVAEHEVEGGQTDIAGMCQELSQGLFQLIQEQPENQPLSSTPLVQNNRPLPQAHVQLQPTATPIRQTNPWAKETETQKTINMPVHKSNNPFLGQEGNGHMNGHNPATGNTVVAAQVHSTVPPNYNNANSTGADANRVQQNGLGGNWTNDMSNSLPAMKPAPQPENFEARWEAFGDDTKQTSENANNPFANAVKTFEVNL